MNFINVLRREFFYIIYYSKLQTIQILPYYFLGVFIGSFISVFLKQKIIFYVEKIGNFKLDIFFILISSFLGILSPLCMFGTIPIIISLKNANIKNSIISSFMMSSILLNPQLFFLSFNLGTKIAILRLFICFLCGAIFGYVTKIFFEKREVFKVDIFISKRNNDINKNLFVRYLLNVIRNIKYTFLYILVGIFLTSIFKRYVSPEIFSKLFINHKGYGILLSSSLGIPLYMCGGGTIPLIREWIEFGMPIGEVMSFMITGPTTKITNLSALKSCMKNFYFVFYICFSIIFSIIIGNFISLFSYGN